MKPPLRIAALLSSAVFLISCDSKEKDVAAAAAAAAADPLTKQDTPMMPVTKGDFWTYDVRLEIPAGVTSSDAAEVDATHQMVRTYLGKVPVGEGLPETECFEVVVPGAPTEREFVEIQNDKILMRGSMILRADAKRPMWLPKPIPFVFAGMKPGTEGPEIHAPGGSLTRKTQVVAREDVTVPAGTYPSIRILMTGLDGELELRRTTWFAPGTGIVREEKNRYRKGKLIYKETLQLVKTSVAGRK